MNTLDLSLFDTVTLPIAALEAAAEPRVATRPAAPAAAPAVLWRQSLAAHETTAGHRWTMRGCYALLGTASAASIAYAAIGLGHSLLSHHGLQAGVASLMGR